MKYIKYYLLFVWIELIVLFATGCSAPKERRGDWMEHMNDVGKDSLLHLANSWYMGANIPGKPRALLSYLGGLENYRQQCRAGQAGNYEKFILNN